MKKVVCLLMICLLVLFFGLGSDALAGKKKIVVANTEWQIQGTGKMYNCAGNYLGSMIGAVGLAQFGEPDEVSTGTIAPVMITNPEGQPAIPAIGSLGVYNLNGYTLKKNNVISTYGNVCIEPPDFVGGDPIEEYPDGACDDPELFAPMNSVFKITKKGTFTGTVKYTLGDCDLSPEASLKNVISVSGRLLGKFPDQP